MNERLTGMLLVISGPSGVGKGTIVKRIMENDPSIVFSVSATTRAPREGEVNHRDYHFVTEAEYDELVAQDAFLEHAEVHGHRYGTLKSEVEKRIADGQNVLLDIDTQGALNVMKKFPQGIYIFILPPSLEELEKRLRGRGTDSEEIVARRMAAAAGEIAVAKEYAYTVVNDKVENTVRTISAIVTAAHARTGSNLDKIEELVKGKEA